MPSLRLHGVVAALATPFREDELLDCGTWQSLIDSVIAAGVDGLLVGGSTGEFFSQDHEERTVALRFVRQACQWRVPVYANVGCITTRETIQLAQAAEAEGIDVLAIVTPYYIKPSQAELAEHYAEVCRAVRLPVLAYNFPQHGGVDILPETVEQVALRCENMVGVKDSSGSLELMTAYQKAAPPGRDFAVFVGPENLTLTAFEKGCAGVISGSSNIVPRLFADLYRAFREGRMETAVKLQALVDQLSGCIGMHTFPTIIKEAAALGPCRKPLGPIPPEVRRRLSEVLAVLEAAGYAPQKVRGVTA